MRRILAAVVIIAVVATVFAICLVLPERGGPVTVKRYRFRHPVSQADMGSITSEIGGLLRPGLIEKLMDGLRGSSGWEYRIMTYPVPGEIVTAGPEHCHEVIEGHLKKHYSGVFRPERIYGPEDVVDVEVFASKVAKIARDVLKRQKFRFLLGEDVELIADDLADFVRGHTRADVSEEVRLEVLEGLDAYMFRYFIADTLRNRQLMYLQFDDRVKTLKFKLWQAVGAEPLSEADKVRLAEQRDWISRRIDRFADDDAMEVATAKFCAGRAFGDVLGGFSEQPMSEKAFGKLQDEIDGCVRVSQVGDLAGRWSMYSATEQFFSRSRKGKRWSSVLGDITGCGGSSDQLNFDFASMKPELHRGWLLGVFSGGKSSINCYDIATSSYLRLSGGPNSYAELEKSAQEGNKGDLYLNSQKELLVACRGAKMAELGVTTWMDADRLSREEIIGMIRARPIKSFSVAGFKGLDNSSLHLAGMPVVPLLAVETKEGELAIVRISSLNIAAHDFVLEIRRRREGWRRQWYGTFLTGEFDEEVAERHLANFTRAQRY